MDAECTKFLKRTRAYHQSSIGLIVGESLRTSKMRAGDLVDATSEFLAGHETRLADVEALLVRHGHDPDA